MTRTRVLAAAALGFALMASAWGDHGEAQRMDRGNAGWPLGSFALQGPHGAAFTRAQLEGRWTLMLFGDTACGEPCAGALSALAGLCLRIAGTQALESTQVLFVSLAPERDTPQRLGRYLARFDRRFVGLTGSRTTVRRLADDLGVSVPAPAGPRPVDADRRSHEVPIVLLGPDGTVQAQFLPPFEAQRLTAAYLKTRLRR